MIHLISETSSVAQVPLILCVLCSYLQEIRELVGFREVQFRLKSRFPASEISLCSFGDQIISYLICSLCVESSYLSNSYSCFCFLLIMHIILVLGYTNLCFHWCKCLAMAKEELT